MVATLAGLAACKAGRETIVNSHMCGRFIFTAEEEEMIRKFRLKYRPKDLAEVLKKRYNIAPSQDVTAVRQSKSTGERETKAYRWGLVPFWARDEKIGYRMINARSETAATKPAFRSAMKYRRCLIPASGFYEWQRTNKGKRKQPFFIHLASGELMAFAGLWERWENPEGGRLETCTILTTSPNEVMAPIHDRMPVILSEENFGQWLDPDEKDAEKLLPLLRPCPPRLIQMRPISTLVNSPKNDGPELLEEVDPAAGDFVSGELFPDL